MPEAIRVGAVFDNFRILPRWFIRANQRFDINRINYTWKTKNGKNTIYHFAVSGGINVFELSYNSGESKWELISTDPS